MASNRKTVLMTGGTGFVGSAVLRALLEAGYRVLATRRPQTPPTLEAAGLRWLETNLTGHGQDDLPYNLPTGSVICHLAAAIPTPSMQDWTDVAAINRILDDTVLKWAKARGARVVYASSASVYGARYDGTIVDEDTPPNPQNPYARSKLASERVYTQALGDNFCALRITAPYGPHQRTRTVVPIFVSRAANGQPLQCFGTGSREQTFVHERDAAAAFVAAVGRPASGVFNIAGDTSVTMRRLAELAAESAGQDPAVTVSAAGRPDPEDGCTARYAIERAAAKLDWRPQVSLRHGLGELVRRAVDAGGAAP